MGILLPELKGNFLYYNTVSGHRGKFAARLSGFPGGLIYS